MMVESSPKLGGQMRKNSAARNPQTQRSLSIPLLVGTLVALAVLLPGLYFWRAHQVEQGAEAYVERADALAKKGQWSQSAEYLFLYLRMRPDDANARIQLAETYDRLAIEPPQLARAVELYYQALATAPPESQRSLRERIGELLIRSGRYASAEIEAKILLGVDPDDAQALREKLLNVGPKDAQPLRILALALYGRVKSGGLKLGSGAPIAVDAALEQAHRLNPTDVQVAVTLADVYRHEPQLQSTEARALSNLQRAKLADECLDRLVQADPKQASAYLARYQYRLSNSLPDAASDLEQVVQLAPENPVVLLAAADHYRRKAVDRGANRTAADRHALLEQAGQFYTRTIRAMPTLNRAYLGLGEVQALEDDMDRAVQTWELGLEKCGKQSILLNARLAEALILQGEVDRAEQCLDSLDSALASLRQRGFLESELSFARGLDVLKARLWLARGETNKAIELVRQVGSGPRREAEEGAFVYQALMLLGDIHATQGQPEQAASAFDNAATARPEAAEPHLAASRVWMAVDRFELATDRLQKAVARDGTAANRLLLAGARLRSQLKLPPVERDWSAMEKSLAEAKSALNGADEGNAWRLSLLEAEFLLRRSEGQADREAGLKAALQVLRSAEKGAGASIDGLSNLAQAYERLGSTTDTDRMLEKLQQSFSETPGAYLTSAVVLARRRQFDKARVLMNQGIATVPTDQRLPLQLGLIELYLRDGREEEAWQTLAELRRQEPSNQNVLEQLLELALDYGNFEEAEKLEQTLRGLSGVLTSDWQFYRARRLLAQASGPQDPRLSEAEELLAEIRQERPAWPRGQLLLGALMERRGNLEKAAIAYQEAIHLGEVRPAVYERLILLLYQLERFKEADKYLTDLRNRSISSSGLATLEISLALRTGQFDRALEAARLATARRPKDPLTHVWLGQLLLAVEKPLEAEKSLRRAVELGPTDPRAFGALVNYYVRRKQLDRARATIEQFAQQIDVPPAKRELLLATGYDAIGDLKLALAHVRMAEKLDPESAVVQERLAASLLRSDGAAAEKALRRALKLNPQSVTARRMLASLLADRGGEDRWREALKILDASGEGGQPTPVDQRMQALLLARRGGTENLAKARHILEALVVAGQTDSRNKRLLLAQVKDAEGNLAGAEEEYLALANATAPLPRHVAAYIDWLLRHDVSEKAGPWLDKLEQLDRRSLLAVALRVRWLDAEKRTDQIEPLLEKTAKRLLKTEEPNAQPGAEQKLQTCLTIGDLYFSVQQYPAAERWYRRAHTLDPEQYNRLARSVAVQGRVAEAIQLCVDAAATDASALSATALATLLVQAYPDVKEVEEAESVLTQALAQHGDNLQLLFSVANLRVMQQRLDEACRLYRHVVELDPHNIEALNNLAMALAEQPGQPTEALAYVERAIQLAGPQPNLLDTKGTILLALDKVEEAIPLLSAAASAPNPDPRFYFHLAVGYYRAGDLTRARETLAIARNRQLAQTVLTESDTRLLEELDARLR